MTAKNCKATEKIVERFLTLEAKIQAYSVSFNSYCTSEKSALIRAAAHHSLTNFDSVNFIKLVKRVMLRGSSL